jgi:hypothetical protein
VSFSCRDAETVFRDEREPSRDMAWSDSLWS